MARIRTIKPEFFRHRRLYQAEQETGLPLRVAFAGLWTVADREGRFRWEPEEIKLDCLPYDDVDFSRVLDALTTRGFLVSYEVDGRKYGWVPGFKDHQLINGRESASVLPEPPKNAAKSAIIATRQPPVSDTSATRHNPARGEGKGREGKYIHKHPDSETLPCAGTPPVGGRDDFGMADQNVAIERIRTTVWRQHGLTDDQIATKRASANTEGVRQAVAWLRLLAPDAICAAIEDACTAAESRGEKIRNPWAYHDAVIRAAAEAATAPEPAAEVLDRSHGGRTLVEWEVSVAIFQKNGFWFAQSHGPKPGEPGCRVPKAILEKAGLA